MSDRLLPVSVVVLTKNSGKTLGECLRRIRSNNPSEIIVVDGLSTDDTLKIAWKAATIIASDQGRGKAFARQLGLDQSTQPLIAYVDSDVFIPPGALGKMIKEISTSRAAAVSCLGILDDSKEVCQTRIPRNPFLEDLPL